MDASLASFKDAGNDAGVLHAFWLLSQLPQLGRATNLREALANVGVHVGDESSVPALCAAVSDAIDARLNATRSRTDWGEMAHLAAVESLGSALAEHGGDLFASGEDVVHAAVAKLQSPSRFGLLAKSFFSRLVERRLSSFLSLELSNHVGAGLRFSDIDGHRRFSAALELHCRQAALVIEAYAGEWRSKTVFAEGGISAASAARFVRHGIKKLTSELLREGPA